MITNSLRQRRWLPPFAYGLAVAMPTVAGAQLSWLEQLHESLRVETRDGRIRADLSGMLDLEGYYIDQRPPGLLVSDGDFIFNPRLTLLIDVSVGSNVSGFVQARADRGFDPGFKPDGDVRLDEYGLRFSRPTNPGISLQIGKFATVVGTWAARHDSWSNAFINAPMAYEEVLAISDRAAPASRGAFVAIQADPANKATWIPAIWGPVYASGASVSGRVDPFEYAVDVKNAALSSRPEVWDVNAEGWRAPTFSGRVGLQPNATWRIGVSVSGGAYLQREARPSLPAPAVHRDFHQTVAAVDLTYAWRHLQVWSEAFVTRFEVPRVGIARAFSYYIETRYKVGPRQFFGVRWNQQLFGSVADGTGGKVAWDRDAWRFDFAGGYRTGRHFQVKLQYSYSHQKGPFQQGEQMLAVQASTRF